MIVISCLFVWRRYPQDDRALLVGLGLLWRCLSLFWLWLLWLLWLLLPSRRQALIHQDVAVHFLLAGSGGRTRPSKYGHGHGRSGGWDYGHKGGEDGGSLGRETRWAGKKKRKKRRTREGQDELM